jgi:pimeloyl-ACP methyl ester carboxylesterase
MVAGIRGARFVTIPQAGHSSSLEQPETVIAAMRELFQSTAAGRHSP